MFPHERDVDGPHSMSFKIMATSLVTVLKQDKSPSPSHSWNLDGNAGDPVVVYCTLPLWHEPCQRGVFPQGETTGYVSQNGHFFRCSHGGGGGGPYSTYFIIDRSGSMVARDVQPQSPQICNAAGFKHNCLANRLGVVYEAVLTYILTRAAVSPADTITFIPFNNSAQVVFSQLSVTDSPSAVAHMMMVTPCGGTVFSSGIQAAHNQLMNDDQSGANHGRTPVFIILTDSGDWKQGQTLQTVQRIMQHEAGTGLKMHCLGFGAQVDISYMEQLAGAGDGAFYNNLESNDLARYCTCVDA